MTPRPDGYVVPRSAPLPAPDPDELGTSLDAEGLADVGIRLRLVPEDHVELEGSNG